MIYLVCQFFTFYSNTHAPRAHVSPDTFRRRLRVGRTHVLPLLSGYHRMVKASWTQISEWRQISLNRITLMILEKLPVWFVLAMSTFGWEKSEYSILRKRNPEIRDTPREYPIVHTNPYYATWRTCDRSTAASCKLAILKAVLHETRTTGEAQFPAHRLVYQNVRPLEEKEYQYPSVEVAFQIQISTLETTFPRDPR